MPHIPLLDATASASLRSIRQCDSKSLADTSWSFARLEYLHIPGLEAIASSSIARSSGTLDHSSSSDSVEFDAQVLTKLAWSLSTIQFAPDPLMHALSAAALNRISAFEYQQLANTAWAVSKLEFKNDPLRTSIAAAALKMLEWDY